MPFRISWYFGDKYWKFCRYFPEMLMMYQWGVKMWEWEVVSKIKHLNFPFPICVISIQFSYQGSAIYYWISLTLNFRKISAKFPNSRNIKRHPWIRIFVRVATISAHYISFPHWATRPILFHGVMNVRYLECALFMFMMKKKLLALQNHEEKYKK